VMTALETLATGLPAWVIRYHNTVFMSRKSPRPGYTAEKPGAEQ
jgi:hypothetical protein